MCFITSTYGGSTDVEAECIRAYIEIHVHTESERERGKEKWRERGEGERMVKHVCIVLRLKLQKIFVTLLTYKVHLK
jgi:hypothetical protein